MLQGDQLTMLGLGNAATAGFGLGIHTRWHFDAALSWPKFGFVLYRRTAEKGALTCVDFLKIAFLDAKRTRFLSDGGSAGKLTAVATASMTPVAGPPALLTTSSRATFTFECSRPMRQFSITIACSSGSMTVRAYDGSMLVATATRAASGTAATMTVAANRFSRVVFEAPTAAEIRRICWAPITDGDWTVLTSLELPRDWATADGRLPSSTSAAVRDRYRNAWPRLDRVIKKIRGGVLTESISERYGAEGSPQLNANYIHLLQAAALDPNLARILGLYFQDETAATGTSYDYKIAGNWTARRSADHAWICFNLSRGVLPAVTRPTGLATDQVEVPGGISGSVKSQTAVALGWTINRSADGQLAQTAPVMYHVYREDRKPTGAWTAVKQLTKGRPVIAKAADSNARYYTDGPLALGTYRYKIAGLDIFGRSSAMSTTSTIALTDTVAPPHPITVAAALVDPDDTSPVDIDVSWSWTSKQREQAGDAKTFRVYHQYEGLYPATGTVTAVTGGSVSDTSDLTTDLDAGGDYSRFTDGHLFHRGKRYSVTDVRLSGGAIVVTVENREDDSGARTMAPAAATASASSFRYLNFLTDAWKLKGRFLLRTDWSNPSHWQATYSTKSVTSAEDYSTTIADVPVTVDSATPTATVMVAVCTEDLNGNVGPLSVPAVVQVRNTTAPAAPSLAIGDDEYATRADWYGKSRYTIALPAAAAGVRYEILRATDAGLANAAMSATELEALAGLEDLTDDDLKAWADETEAEDSASLAYRTAFMNVGSAAAAFEDEFPGAGRNRYVYKIRSIDSANNRGEFADAFVVHLHDVTPPAVPVVTSIFGGNREITLTWAPNQERDLAGYRLYRTAEESWSSDIRSMDMVSEMTAGTETCTDAVDGLTDFYYRLVAYDTQDNVSAATPTLRGRAYDATPPLPPSFTASAWTAVDGELAVHLEWDPVSEGVTVLVQRQEESTTEWTGVSGWLESGVTTYHDTDAEPFVMYVYRLRVRSAAGLLNDSFNEAAVTALYANA